MKTLVIATRESPLAVEQANWVKVNLEKKHPDLKIKLLGITTSADKILEIPLTEVGGKGLFVKELEEALLDERADIAVHSMKDVPVDLPAALSLPVICKREDPRDVFVANDFDSLSALPPNAIVGTSSLRRQSQLLALRPDLTIKHLRGNVNTRLKKLDRQEYSALILAAAGLKRLGLSSRIEMYFDFNEMLPAPGQGALAIECRTADFQTQKLIATLNDPFTANCVMAERALSKHLGGGCQAPVAAYAEIQQDKIFLRALVAKEDGSKILRSQQTAAIDHPEKLGIAVAEDLITQGAREVLFG